MWFHCGGYGNNTRHDMMFCVVDLLHHKLLPSRPSFSQLPAIGYAISGIQSDAYCCLVGKLNLTNLMVYNVCLLWMAARSCVDLYLEVASTSVFDIVTDTDSSRVIPMLKPQGSYRNKYVESFSVSLTAPQYLLNSTFDELYSGHNIHGPHILNEHQSDLSPSYQ